MKLKKILVGSIHQESHSFNPLITRRDAFRIDFGDDALAGCRGTNSTTGGIIDAAEALGVEVILPVSYRASSSGVVDHEVYLEACEPIIEAARKGGYDAIVMSLHGGMVTTGTDDPEGDLMHRLRKIVGADMPMTAGLDLHAHVTPHTIASCDFLTAYKTNPHADMAATGRRAFEAARAMVEEGFKPIGASVHFPMLTLGNDRTDEEPLQGMHAYAVAQCERHDALFDISIFNVQQFLNIKDMGQTVVAYTNGDVDLARGVADEFGQMLWDKRDELIGTYPSLESCLRKASEPDRKTPVIIGDQGDRVSAGGPGDSTFILTKVLADYPDLKVAIPIRDKPAVERLGRARVGDAVTVTVGGTYSKETPPVALNGTVFAMGDNAQVTLKGPSSGGLKIATGPYVVVRVKDVYVVLNVKPFSYQDPNFYNDIGIAAKEMDVLVARSGYHFSLNFASLGECITADTPGMTAYCPQDQPFTVARPFYPVDKIGYQPTRAVNGIRQ
ncbi:MULTISPECIES: M81 family metallopeptidase [unclassified Achromobacter]|uniref:M81 family metallopeptidase n=1 Tax=unclassified Achromobacter TaxID=2626865 RepID=UPI000B51A6BD|nr:MULTISPECIES: M81 family metallopeptidase [unclassified Achromobacter]OWT73757.1 microcystin degradation protein MlrC [Achromobacter sp. HZ34]OWT79327.1 microcystin degradation protein MlrC [Achromobacter sp. HZ28]